MRKKKGIYKITNEVVEKMIKLREEGNSYQRVSEILGVNQSTVYTHLRNKKQGEGNFRKSKYIIILEALEEGKSDEEIIKLADTTLLYIRQVTTHEANRKKEIALELKKKEKYKKENENIDIKIQTRKDEVKKICEEIKKKKAKEEMEYQKMLKEEVEALKERFKGIVR